MELLKLQNLKMYYGTLRGDVRAVDDISFTMEKKDTVGLAGESGCGKTSAMLAILRLQPPNAKVSGEILFQGKNLLKMSDSEFRKNIRWKKISTIFQGAMNALHPTLRVGDQITEAILAHESRSKQEATEIAGKLFDLVGIGSERLDRYSHELSGGMKQRTMIAMSLACNPELIIADEPTTALDVIIEAQVLKVMKELQEKLGLSMIVISHDLSMIAETCNKAAIMYAGKIVEFGGIVKVFTEPLHPYTQKLIAAFPSILGSMRELASISGFPPDLLSPPPACRFHPRCPYAMNICRKEEPRYIEADQNRYVACHLVSR